MSSLIDITMPSLGADMTEGMLVEWSVKAGDRVKAGDIIAVLETQKGLIDMEVYHDGIIKELLCEPLVKLPIGTVMARVESTDVQAPPVPEVTQPDVSRGLADEEISSLRAKPSPVIPDKQGLPSTRRASPVVRKIANERQLELSEITGSGPNGAILLCDIAHLTHSEKESPSVTDEQRQQSMRSAIASAMEKSKKEIPHFYLSLSVDIGRALNWLQKTNKNKPPDSHILLLPLLIKAVARALEKYPRLNGFYLDNQFVQADEINIGNVINLRTGGMQVPAIHNADTLSIDEIMFALRDITARSRAGEGRLRSSELSDSTITVTNMGERGTDLVMGVIYPPQVAIVGLGKPREVPRVEDGKLVVAKVLTVSLSADHRVIDGMLAAKFLNAIAKQLQKPESL